MATRRPAEHPHVEAAALVPAPPEEVFDFLSDLGNHWRLTDRFVRVVELIGPPDGPADGGTVRLRGPFGLHRTVRTHVSAARRPRLMIGIAEIGSSTRARVSWTLGGRLGQTRVLLSAEVEHASPGDRLLLALGGRIWLERLFERTLARLAQRFAAEPSASVDAPVRGGLDDDPAGPSLE